MPLTDATCRNATCPEGKARERYADSKGLYLEVRPAGGKYWYFKHRFANKEKRLSLGTYPDVPLASRVKRDPATGAVATTIKGARDLRDEARALLKAGTDPVQAKLDGKQAQRIRIGTTFERVARDWFEHWRTTKTPRHADYVLRRLEADVFPVIGAKPVGDITAQHLLAMAKKIEARDALDIARRAWQMAGQVLEHALAHGLVDRNAAKDVRPGVALKARTKVNYARLDAKEVPQLLRRMDAYQGTPHTRLAMQLLALTFVRTSELIGARWDEFDLDAAEWRLPAERMKMRTPHVVPLSTQAAEVINTLTELRNQSALLFPGERNHDKPMSNNTILKALDRMGYKHRMTGHGFRSIASTILHELGHRHDVIELQLAHQERNKVSAAYNWATYLPERRVLMQVYADHLDALRKGAKVLPFKAA